MQIPSMVYGDLVGDDGQMSETWMNDINQVFSQLQRNFSDEGYTIPGLPTATIAELSAPASSNALLIDSDTQEVIINLGGTWVKLVTAPYP